MIVSQTLLGKIADLIDEGLIVVDRAGAIRVYNEKARSIFRIDPPGGPGHTAGAVQAGDVILLVDNSLGRDDGGLVPQDLAKFGVDTRGISRGMSIVACGVVGAAKGKAVWQVGRENQDLSIGTAVSGLNVAASLDHKRQQFTIRVGDQDHIYRYQTAAGHMVVLDGQSHAVKFYQTRGYTARREDAKAVIEGRPYRAKGDDQPRLDLIGRHILEVHPEGTGIKGMMELLGGDHGSAYLRREYEINGWPVRCSLFPLEEGDQIIGGMLLVEDITELKLVRHQRDQAMALASRLEKHTQVPWLKPESFSGIIGHHPTFIRALGMAARAAQSSSTVLLLGGSGTGKGLLARAIHEQSPRHDGPFVYINCAAIPEALLESELFGYDEGAFTGAKKAGKVGAFELAHQGSIFLDEIGELSLPLQAKLLHVLQYKTLRRVGGVKEISFDTRILAASNRNLDQMVRDGLFREDLYYRLNVLPIRLPGLAERGDDVLELAEELLPRICTTVGVGRKQLSQEVIQFLQDYHWPGNIRELENVLERAVNLADGELIQVQHLPDALQTVGSASVGAAGWCEVKRLGSLADIVGDVERQALSMALEQTHGDKQQAQKLLGLGRSAFYERLRRFSLTSSGNVD